MKAWLKKWKWSLISLAVAMILAVSCGAFTYFGTFEEIDSMLIDSIAKHIDLYKDDVPIRIIAIDEKTVAELGTFDTWSRQVSADIVKRINSGDETPVIIGMDLLYNEKKGESGDAAFVEACEAAGNVCLMVKREEQMPDKKKPAEEPSKESLEESAEKTSEEPSEGDIFLYPYDELAEVVQIGFADVLSIVGNVTVREFMPQINVNEKKLDNFAVVLYKAYQDHVGRDYHLAEMEEESNAVRFNYSRGISEYETYSFIDVLNGGVGPSEFANKIVIIGDYTEESGFDMPNQQGRDQMPDAGLQASIVEALLSQKVVNQIPSEALAGVYGILIFVCYCLAFLIKRKKSILYSIFVLFLHFQLAFILRNWCYLPVFPLWLYALFAMILGLFIGYYREKENKRNLKKALTVYVESDVVEQILENNDFDIKPGSEKRDIAVLFVDIRGFTTISEKLPPEEIVRILNEYLELVAEAVVKNEGSIDKFIGDAAMAIYNAPKDLDDYALKAVYTAWDILKGADGLKEDCFARYGAEVTFGIGIHCGPAVVGNIGCEYHMDYTAIGDTVNTASRLEGSAKAGQILISSDVYERVKDFVKVNPIGNMSLKGKSQEVETYQVTGIIRKGVSA